MKMKLTHLISDLIHAPMYRLYENEAGSIKYIIRECHMKNDMFKYQLVGTVSAMDITPDMRRKVLSELAEDKLVFLYENLLFEPIYDSMITYVKDLHVITGLPYKVAYYWDMHIYIPSDEVHKQNQIK